MPVFAEGRVENQKLNQTAALLSFAWVFGFHLDLLEKNLLTLPGFTIYFVLGVTAEKKMHIFSTMRTDWFW